MTIDPFSPIGFIVLGIFATGLLLIILEVQLEMDKFKPAQVQQPALCPCRWKEPAPYRVHLRFLPAVLVNFFGSLGVWYLQFEMFG